MISRIARCVWFLTKAFYCAFSSSTYLLWLFLWSCRYGGFEGIPASHILRIWRHTCFSYFTKSKTRSKGETSHKPWSRCASVWIFLVDGVWTPLYAPSLSFSFFLEKGLSFLLSFFLTCRSMWHTFFGYASFIIIIFDMPKHVAYLLWVCIFYFLFA